MQKRLLIFALLMAAMAASAAPLHAQKDAPAQEAFSFLDLPFSARPAVLGGAVTTGATGDVALFFHNPANLQPSMHNSLAVSYVNHLSDFNAGMAAFSRHVDGIGTLAGGVRYLSYGSFDEATSEGERTGGTFRAGDLALSTGISRSRGERFRYGGALNLLYSHLAGESAGALTLDAGAVYQIPTYELTLSATVNNLGTHLGSIGEEAAALPTDLQIGLSKRLAHLPLAITLTGHDLHRPGYAENTASALDDVLHHLAVGGEFLFSEAFQVRLGYNHHRHQTLKMGDRLDFAGFGAGFGLALAGFQFDYGFNSWSSLGGLHFLTVRTQL